MTVANADTLTNLPVDVSHPDSRTWRLTVKQLREASEDLCEAAELVNEHGHTRGHMIEKTTGALCALGALEAATYRRLVRIGRDNWTLLLPERITDADLEHRIYRCDNATIVFAETVRHLCECPGRGDEKLASDLVSHYNDAHCVGGVLLINMMRLAAARAIVLANYKQDRIDALLYGC